MKEIFQTPMEILKDFWNTPACEKAWAEFLESKSPKKEWEIVAFAGDIGLGHRVYELCDDGQYRWRADLDKIPRSAKKLVNLGCTIHSVRRLSDDWVVSVKDKVKTTAGEIGTIKSFDATGHILFEDITGLEHITTIQKLPQPILTTVDGVEIFPGQEFFQAVDPTTIHRFFAQYTDNPQSWEGMQLFSTLEAAKKYNLDHSPLLSLNDVKNAAGASYGEHVYISVLNERLTALVKQKLNQ